MSWMHNFLPFAITVRRPPPGDRQANSALWKIVITRMVHDARTRDYIHRRTKEGLTKKEAFRCLKRYIAREAYNCLPRNQLALDDP
jgi:transposase